MRPFKKLCCAALAFILMLGLALPAAEVRAAAGSDVKAELDPSEVVLHLEHYSFSNAFCAAYVYAGTTVSTKLEFSDKQGRPVAGELRGDISFISSDESVAYVDEEKNIVAVSEGVAQISAEVDGTAIALLDDAGYVGYYITVEVMPTPLLSYEMDGRGNILINYGEFNSNLTLYYKGTRDELWTMGNREADGIYTHYYPDTTETYTYVMRYYDDVTDQYAEVGEPLVVKLGNAEPTPTPTPTPTPEPEPDPNSPVKLLPAIPERSGEPSVEEAIEALGAVMAACPRFTEWPDDTEYSWQGGPFGKWNTESGLDSYGFSMAVSDRIFGSLPSRVLNNVTVDDLRPGDIILTKYNTCLIVTRVAPDYVLYACTTDDEVVLWDCVSPDEEFAAAISYAVTRYSSDAPGARAQTPGIVPAGAEISRSGSANVMIDIGDYLSVLEWALTEDGTLYLWGWGNTNPGDIPEAWDAYRSEIKRVVIGPNISKVGWTDFDNCPNLEEAVLGEDVSVIDTGAFKNCPSLRKINLENIEEIGDSAFSGCGFETLELPEGLESIGEKAFSDNLALAKLRVPVSLREMGKNAFSGCEALAELDLPEGLSALSYGAFSGCEALKTVTVPGSVKELPDNIFYSCEGLETLYLSEGVESIGEYAFYLCYELRELHFPNTLRSIGSCAFDQSEKLSDVYFYGSEDEWNAVQIDSNNIFLQWFAMKHFVDGDACRHQDLIILPAVEAGCTASGLSAGKVCNDCGELIEAQESIPAAGHDWDGGEVTKEPSVSDRGERTYTCLRCGELRRESIDKLPAPEPEPQPAENPFADVQDDAFYFRPVLWAVENGITSGTSAVTFSPDAVCTRAQVVTFLWRAAGEPLPESGENPFADVGPEAYYYNAVLWAVEKGVTSGTSAVTFSPDAPCTRAQVVTFLWRAETMPEPESSFNPFEDVAADAYYRMAVLWAMENGITMGLSDSLFGPDAPCTRGQIVTFLYRNFE